MLTTVETPLGYCSIRTSFFCDGAFGKSSSKLLLEKCFVHALPCLAKILPCPGNVLPKHGRALQYRLAEWRMPTPKSRFALQAMVKAAWREWTLTWLAVSGLPYWLCLRRRKCFFVSVCTVGTTLAIKADEAVQKKVARSKYINYKIKNKES